MGIGAIIRVDLNGYQDVFQDEEPPVTDKKAEAGEEKTQEEKDTGVRGWTPSYEHGKCGWQEGGCPGSKQPPAKKSHPAE